MPSLESAAFGPPSHSMGKGIERRLGPPPCVGNDCDRIVANGDDFLDTGHAFDLCGIEALELSAEHRAGLDGSIEHPRTFHVDAVDLGAVQLFGRVEPLDGFSGNRPVLGILELNVLRSLELRGRVGDLAIACRAA